LAEKVVKIRLFIKPYCGWCHKAMRWLDDHDIVCEKIDVIADAAAFDQMVALSGQELAPVLEVDGKVLADFGPEELPGFFENLEGIRLIE
jgi:glutaredoxin 3